MPSSDKRTAANRANASKSTGPRTPEGKAKSRLNALAHGLTAQTAVLPGEDPDQLEALSAALMKQLKPRGVVQRIIAERIVSLAWKLRRVARAEEDVAMQMRKRRGYDRIGRDLGRADGPRMLAESIRYNGERYLGESHDTRLTRLTEYELKLDAALRAGVRELMRLQKEAGRLAEEDSDEEQAPAEVTAWVAPEVAPEAEAPPAAEEAPIPQNEPNPSDGNDGAEGHDGDDPGLSCAAPAAWAAVPDRAEVRGDATGEAALGEAPSGEAPSGEAPVGETNPLPGGGEVPQVDDAPGVTPDSPSGSSAPVPGTFSSPPPAPRR